MPNNFGLKESRATLQKHKDKPSYYSLEHVNKIGMANLETLPFTIRILLENAIRHCGNEFVSQDDITSVGQWDPKAKHRREFPFMPSRVLMQDFTGIPAIVDLAAMRSAIAREGGNPAKINPLIPTDLVIDHSVQVDYFGNKQAFQLNVEKEFQRNSERYTFLRWAQNTFDNFNVVPPGTGIVHQVNLEYLSSVITFREAEGSPLAFPDTLVGTDSHTTMVNGLGVLGWGVGGIEAEAAMLGQPLYMEIPDVIGFKLSGALQHGVTATDLVLTITQILRKKGVVEKFVEFFGPGLDNLQLPDRATIANMAPESGSTCSFFPVDQITLDYLLSTGRSKQHVEAIKEYSMVQKLLRTTETPDPAFSDVVELDLNQIVPSLAGPRRPQDKVRLGDVRKNFYESFDLNIPKKQTGLNSGSVVIAAITSCTNTSNPSVMIGAGLLAKNSVSRGLKSKPWVKTSMAPGSQVVTDYMNSAGLTDSLEKLGFYTVGYGCTTCIGNSGPLPEEVSKTVNEQNLIVVSVLSGNRNFEGRVHPQVKASYLASPLLVVAYALTGTIDINLENEPVGFDMNEKPVYLREIWPTQEEISQTISKCLNPDLFKSSYKDVSSGPKEWRSLPTLEGDLYPWDEQSTYIREVPFFQNANSSDAENNDISGARVLVMLGDSITTDHISPAGAIPAGRPAASYLIDNGVSQADFNTFGTRRGNHEVMVRGTFGNIRLKNLLTPDKEGDWTIYLPTDEVISIFDASQKYIQDDIPTIIIAGNEYGSGSSRDWAAKGSKLLGVKAVIAGSYERIHRNNLIGMGLLPLQFVDGETPESLRLTGKETYDIRFPDGPIEPSQSVNVIGTDKDGHKKEFIALCRLDTPAEVNYFKRGGMLLKVMEKMLS